MSVESTIKYVAAQLKEARLDKRLTQAELAKLADTDANYYAKIERGEAVPSFKIIIRLVQALDVDYSDIFPKRTKE